MQPIDELFAHYEEAFRALDFEKQADMYADAFVSAGPRGSIARGKAEFFATARQAAEFYRSMGFVSATILSRDDHPISDQYVLATVHWRAVFQQDVDIPVEFDVSYIVQALDGRPEIVMFISHQDEAQFMEQLRSGER
ncbi:MAG: DUF4440 domain-containing protein [Methanomicrobiaceae archaeon]|nr:DUF4440 domain-containing protein [Methanomicrobiaceae archaeon]